MQVAADAVSETHADVDKLIWKECHHYSKRNGVPLEAIHEVAEDCFVDAFVRYDPARGRFTTCLVTYIRHGLWKEAQANSRSVPTISRKILDQYVQAPYRVFDLDEFTEDLTADSALLIWLLTHCKSKRRKPRLKVFSIPKDSPIGCYIEREGQSFEERRMLKGFLLRLGWSLDRITESFAEIGRALR